MNNILFVLLIQFRYPLIDQKTQKETENSLSDMHQFPSRLDQIVDII